MTLRMSARSGAIVCVMAAALISAARLLPQIPAARDVVKPATYASFEPVARGKKMEIAVVMKIRYGI